MGKSQPLSRLGLEGNKRKSNSILRDCELPDIVPPSSFNTGKLVRPAPKGAHDSVIDIDQISEDYTPTGRASRKDGNADYMDFSVVFGDEPEAFHFPGGGANPGENDGSLKKRAKKRTAQASKAPEQQITIFAFRLAIIEKAATMIGKMSFLWATVVLLGGFSTAITFEDFWVVTVIIVAEGARIFNRSHELEWQRLSSKSTESLGGRLMSSFKLIRHPTSMIRKSGSILDTDTDSSAVEEGSPTTLLEPLAPELQAPMTRTWSKLTLPVLPFVGHYFTTEVISTALYILQLISATLCIGLAIWRLSQTPAQGGTRVLLSLNLFYSLSAVEAGLFLIEKCYWEYKFRALKILHQVVAEAELGEENLDVVKQFYYDVYAECLKESVFDGLEMDLVSYSISWLQGDDFTQQLAGAKLLNRLVSEDHKPRHTLSAKEVLRTIGTTPGIIERLVEMLSWDSRQEKVLLGQIATIVCRLVAFNRNCSRIVAVPGSMDGVVSLLMTYNDNSPEQRNVPLGNELNPQLWLIGLSILKYLCKDHKNSLKIGETPRLLAILVTFIEVRDESSFKASTYSGRAQFKNRLKTYKKSLQVLGLLAAATNTPGAILRRRIMDVVSGLKNLRDTIQYGYKQPVLQRLAVEIIFNLAMEGEIRQRIGATGGVLRSLFELFTQYESVKLPHTPPGIAEPVKERKVRGERILAAEKAGKALTRLALQDEKNCRKMLRLRDASSQKTFLEVMVDSLLKPESIASSAAKILSRVMEVADEEAKSEVAMGSAPVVLEKIMTTTKSEMYQACLELASRALGALDSSFYTEILNKVDRVEFVKQLMKNLQHTPTTDKFPGIRRYSVDLILAFMAKDDSFLDAFQRTNIDLREMLERTLDSISEVENFCLFCGLSGYVRYDTEMEDLVLQAIAGVESYNTRSQKEQSS